MKHTRVTLATASSVLLLAALAACAGSDPADQSSAGGPVTSQAGVGPGDGRFPGASGRVAAISGRTAQVQSDVSGQVAVSWNDDTTFTRQVDATRADVALGSCVMVTGDDGSDRTSVTAVSVRILDECVQPSGMPTDLPTPSDVPSDVPSDLARAGGFGTTGEVTAVSGDGFTVAGMGDEEVTVTVTGDTAYTTSASATASAVAVGACVAAEGDTDDTGALTATSISVSEPVDGACTGGLMMRGGPGAAR